MPLDDLLATVIVVTWNGADMVAGFLRAVAKQRGELARFRTVVVDNDSTDGTREMLARDFPDVEVIASPSNLGFGGGCNLGLRAATTPYVIIANNDVEPEPDWLHELLAVLEDPANADVAAVTPKALFAGSGRINNTGSVVRTDGYAYDRGYDEPDDGRYATPEDVFTYSGIACAFRASVLEQTGLIDEDITVYYEDVDLAWRMRLAGWRIRYQPTSVVRHMHSATMDAGSKRFVFYNERNRLITLTKNAPAGMALKQVLRFPVTTAAIALRKLRRAPVPAVNQFSVRLRLKVMASYLRLLPVALLRRRQVASLVPAGTRPAAARRALTREFEPAPRRRPA